MKAVLIVACCLAVALAGPLTERQYQTAFQGFAERFNKNYDVAELFHRFAIFKDNLDYINTENGKNLTYTLGVNEFSDLTHSEFVATFLGRRSSIKSKGLARDSAVPNRAGANAIDWRDKGAVTPVKNQGSCGSCWAFSATGGIESAHFVASGKLINLAEQQLVDCCRGSSCGGSMGCNGGEEADAMEWVAHNKDSAQCASEEYPYTARDGTCKKTCKPVVNIAGVKRVIGEPALVAALNIVPTTVAVDASARGWQSYAGGVFDTTCSRRLNHAILAVGYTDNYWTVKNSWGASWGDKGYIHMIRGKNLCGIDDEPAYAF